MPQLGFENITSTDIETVNKKITASGVMLTVGVVGELRGNIVYIMDKASSMKTASKMMMGMPVDTLDEMPKTRYQSLQTCLPQIRLRHLHVWAGLWIFRFPH